MWCNYDYNRPIHKLSLMRLSFWLPAQVATVIGLGPGKQGHMVRPTLPEVQAEKKPAREATGHIIPFVYVIS